jgi:hypothetical protein
VQSQQSQHGVGVGVGVGRGQPHVIFRQLPPDPPVNQSQPAPPTKSLISLLSRLATTILFNTIFDLMTCRNGEHPANEEALFAAYKEFTTIVEQTFYEKEKSSAFFTLTNVHIELLQVQKDGKNSDNKKNVQHQSYLNKAILTLK